MSISDCGAILIAKQKNQKTLFALREKMRLVEIHLKRLKVKLPMQQKASLYSTISELNNRVQNKVWNRVKKRNDFRFMEVFRLQHNTGWPALLETPGNFWNLLEIDFTPGKTSWKIEKTRKTPGIFFFHIMNFKIK